MAGASGLNLDRPLVGETADLTSPEHAHLQYPMMKQHWPLIAIIATYFVVGGLVAVRTPAWQAPDEPAHYNYTRQLIQTSAVPVIAEGDWTTGLVPLPPDARDIAVDRLTYEDHQPPLFYVLSAPLFAIAGGQLTVLRLFALSVGAFALVFAYLAVAAIFPTHVYLAAFAATFIALLPQRLAIMAGYNNDALSEALLALTVLLGVRMIMDRRALTRRNLIGLGIVVGLCFITKAQAYLALPVALIAVFLGTGADDDGRVISFEAWLKPALIVAGVGALIGLPWWVRNMQLYGAADFLGLQRHNEVVTGQPTTAEWLAEYGFGGWLARLLQTTFQSFWGQFGWMTIPLGAREYLVLLAFTVLSAGLFVAWWWHGHLVRRRLSDPMHACAEMNSYSPYLLLTVEQSRALTMLAALALFTMLAFLWYNLQFVQHQGRYLYPALIPIATACALGWGFALSRFTVRGQVIGRWAWLVLLIALAAFDVYLLFRVILPQMGA